MGMGWSMKDNRANGVTTHTGMGVCYGGGIDVADLIAGIGLLGIDINLDVTGCASMPGNFKSAWEKGLKAAGGGFDITKPSTWTAAALKGIIAALGELTPSKDLTVTL